MKKSNVKFVLIFLLFVPLIISITLSCTNYNPHKRDRDYVDNLYVPDTINNREHYKVRKSNSFAYATVAGLLTIAGITYLIVRKKKDN